MKRNLWIINLFVLIINTILFLVFAVYTILGSTPAGNYVTNYEIEFQLIFALIFEFSFFAVSLIISKILKIDLSFKGRDFLKLVPKTVALLVILVGVFLIAYTAIFNISAEFAVMTSFMLFSILLQIGITKLFRMN